MPATLPNPNDRLTGSLAQAVELQHVDIRVPDQIAATNFYIGGLGLTRDPYLITGADDMWPMSALATSTCQAARHRFYAAPLRWRCRSAGPLLARLAA